MQLEIKTTIDAFNPNQVKALNDFLTAIGGHTQDEGCTSGIIQMEGKPKAIRKKSDKETFATVETTKEALAEQDEVKTQNLKPEPIKVEAIEVVEPETVSAPTLMQIRSLVAQKAAEHKDSIKSKLVELGAQNVSTLDAKHYQAIFDFLNTL